MSTAIAAAPPPASLPPSVEHHIPSPLHFTPSSANVAPTSAPPSAERSEPVPKRPRSDGSPSGGAVETISVERSNSNGNNSPTSARTALPPMIKVKKEPGSPNMASSRPRPKRLDLSTSISNSRGPSTARPSAPLTSRESGGLTIQDMGLTCLSPGFQTHDPAMREQLQRSLDVRDRQRQIIEARQKGSKPDSAHESEGAQRSQDNTLFGVQMRTPTTSRRKGPPPGLSIAAPSASHFANDRVIQSAPLGQTFTGLRPGDHPYTRHTQHGPSGLSGTSHIHHIPATQTNNRLPPIADVFANDRLDVHRPPPPLQSPSFANGHPPVPSPGFPPPQHPSQQPPSAHSREFRSAEEAMAGLSGGREDLMPKVVHYGGVHPPTPPSPMAVGNHHPPSNSTAAGAQQQPPHLEVEATRPDIVNRTLSMNGRRRDRDEFERDNGSPPSHLNRQNGQPEPKQRITTFAVRGGEEERKEDRITDWMNVMSNTEKRDEFLRLCERAWDLFHS